MPQTFRRQYTDHSPSTILPLEIRRRPSFVSHDAQLTNADESIVLSDLIHPCQSAFLKGRLISDNVMLAADLMHQVHSARGKRKKLAALKLDFSKAFDRIDHESLLEKLQKYGFDQSSLRWIRSYLTDRKQAPFKVASFEQGKTGTF